jgi:hypothetical protein
MPKNLLSLLSIFVFVGCAQIQKTITPGPSKTIQNDKCFESQKMKVFQVLEDGILAHICPTEYPSYFDNAFDACATKGDIVYMSVNPKQNDYVDDQKIELPENNCFGSDGTYSYLTAKDNLKKTVRKIRIINSEVPNPSYVEAKKK